MKVEPIEFSVDGQKLRGNLYVPTGDTKNLAVLFLHGWTGKPNEAAAKVVAEQGYYAMTLSIRGHNNSEGDIKVISRRDSLNDAIAAYDLFKSKLPDDLDVVVVGTSYGSYLASLLSAERKVARLSLRVPAGYPDAGFDEVQWGRGGEDPVVAAWRQKKTGFTENRALRAVHELKGKVQIIEAEHDEQVASQTVKNYADAVTDKSQLEYLLMKGWPHSLGDDPRRNQEYQQVLLHWLQED